MPRLRKLAAFVVVSAAAVGALVAAPGAAGANPLEPREGRPECRHVPECRTVKTNVQELLAGQPVSRELACPAGTYFWNWSATVAQFVQVVLVPFDDGPPFHGGVFNRHEFNERSARDHQPAHVLREMTGEAD